MSDREFFTTRMGHRYYEITMPAIADGLKELNGNLKTLVAELRASNQRANAGHTTPSSAIPSPGDRAG